MFFVLFVIKKHFLLTQPNMFFLFLRTKIVFQTSVSKHNFISKKNQKLFLKTIFQNNDILIVNGKITTFYSILMVINNKKILLIKNIEFLDIKVLFVI